MTRTAQDQRMLRALAKAMGNHPRSTLRELAQLAGVSKATLHRFCSTREHLIELLMSFASQELDAIVGHAQLDAFTTEEGLARLIRGNLEQPEIHCFLMNQIQPDTLEQSEGSRWIGYFAALDRLFLRGQQEGVFRIDLSAAAMTELFTSSIWALIDAERRGRVARASCAAMVESFFLRGVAVSSGGLGVNALGVLSELESNRFCVLLMSEDDGFAELLSHRLEMLGLRVDWVQSRDRLAERLRTHEPDALIIDPPVDRRDWSQLINCTECITLLLTTGETVAAFEGVDCIPRNSEPELILARVRTLLRRNSLDDQEPWQGALSIGALVLQPLERLVTWRGHVVELSTTELRVLEVLMRFAGETLSREELSQRIRGRTFDPDDRLIDVTISKLRRKFADRAHRAQKIKTIWGRGYALNPEAW